jgi:hypothetical protein
MKNFFSWAAALIAGLGLMAGVPSGARADTMYNLVTGGTLPGLVNYGSVDVKTVTGQPNELEVVVTLSGNNHFANSSQNNTILGSFAFNLNGFNTITVSGLPAIWSAESTSKGSIPMDGAGTFQYALTFSNGGNTDGTSLDFFIHATGIGSSTANVTGVAADLCTKAPSGDHSCGGEDDDEKVKTVITGAVVGTLVARTDPVPAPFVGAGLPGLIAACMGLVALARRRRHRFA